MGFAQEMKDFAEGYKSGQDIKESKSRLRAADDLHEKNRMYTEAEVSGGSLAGAAPAIPESSSSGGGGGGGTTSGKGMRGDELAWKDAAPEQKALLNTIAGPESGGRYNVIYGGGSFSDYKDHPRQDVRIRTGPNANRTSSAAGKYQFLGSTWDEVRKRHPDVTDFSPENQDKAAWYLASDTYKQKTGQDLATVLKTGSPQQIADVGKTLSPIWTSLPSGIEQGQNADKFVSTFEKYKTDAGATTATAAADKPAAAAPAATAATTTQPADDKVAMLSKPAGFAIPEDQQSQQQPEQTALIPPDEQVWGQGSVFAATGGVIPEPVQHFETGGQPYVPEPNPNNPSNVTNGGDQYSRFRNYTQQITPTTGTTGTGGTASATTPRRISFPTTNTTATTGQTDSQKALADARAARAAATPAATTTATPVAAVAAKPAQSYAGQMWYAPGGGGSGQQQFVQIPTGRGPNRNWAEGGMIPEPSQNFATGGKVDPNARFKELLRQETPLGPQVGDRGDGESPHDRAARRLSAEKGKASSTAYHMHSEYWKPAPKKKGGGGDDKTGPSKEKTSSTAKPIEEDRKTRFRKGDLPAEEDRLTRERRPGDVTIPTTPPLPDSLPIELQDKTAIPVPGLAGVPPDLADAAAAPAPDPRTGESATRPTVGTVKVGPTAETATRPTVGTVKVPAPAPQPAPQPYPRDPARTAADEADTRRRMELATTPPSQPQPAPAPAAPPALRTGEGAVTPTVGTSKVPAPVAPAANQVSAAVPEPDDGSYPDVPQQDWSGTADQRQQIGATLLRSILNPTGQRLLGFASGGAVPEPGEPGYNEYVGAHANEPAAGGAVVTPEFSRQFNQSARGSGGPGPGDAYPAVASSGDSTASIPPPAQDKHQPTPKLLSDVATALHHGAQYLTQHFGLSQQGAVQTPEGQQQQEDGMRRFASGEGAATPQEVSAIDDKIDPQRQMSEGDRQMTRSAKIVQWYLERGRKEEAGAAAAGLMQYGAQRFGQIGSLAAAAYAKGDMKGTVNALKSAYQYIPDGGGMDIHVDPKTNKLVVTHTDEAGKESDIPIKPEDLPGIIKSVQDKSMYWQQVMTLADPEGQHIKDRAKATESEWNRTHGIERGEKLTDADTAAKAEAAKNDRELQEKIAAEKRATAQKEIDTAAANKTENERALRDAAIRRAEKTFEGRKDIDWDALNPLITAAQDANNADDADTDEGKARIAEAESRIFDALPEKTRNKDFNDMGYDRSTLQYVPKAAQGAVPKQAPDGNWYVPDPDNPKGAIQVKPPASAAPAPVPVS